MWRAAELVGWIILTLAMLGALGLISFTLRVGLADDPPAQDHLCTERGQLQGRAYPCTEAEWRSQGKH